MTSTITRCPSAGPPARVQRPLAAQPCSGSAAAVQTAWSPALRRLRRSPRTLLSIVLAFRKLETSAMKPTIFVVRFVFVIRVPVCARLSCVCPGSPGVFLPGEPGHTRNAHALPVPAAAPAWACARVHAKFRYRYSLGQARDSMIVPRTVRHLNTTRSTARVQLSHHHRPALWQARTGSSRAASCSADADRSSPG
jgi:hypothetical protein